MGAFGFVEHQRASDRFEDAVGDSREVPAFEPGVVVDAHASEYGDFFASETGNASCAVVDGQTDLLGRDAGAPGRQELANVVTVVHDGHATTARQRRGEFCCYLAQRHLPRSRQRGFDGEHD